MNFENCPTHSGEVINTIDERNTIIGLVCHQCFMQVHNKDNISVRLNKQCMEYFFAWNHFLINELIAINGVIRNEGVGFLFDRTILSNLSPYQSSQQDIQTQARQILHYVIEKHIILLSQNLQFMSQPKPLQELINPMFLNDIYSIVLRKMQDIIQPVMEEFTFIIKKEFEVDWQLQWKNQVVHNLQRQRKKMLDERGNQFVVKKICDRNKFNSTICSASGLEKICEEKEQEEERLSTQDSLDKSLSSCGSLNLDQQKLETQEEEQQIQLDQSNRSEMQYHSESAILSTIYSRQSSENYPNTTNFLLDQKIASLQLQLQRVSAQNISLRKQLDMKDMIIDGMSKKLQSSQQQTKEWVIKYKQLEKQYEHVTNERIPIVEKEIISLTEQIETLLGFSEEQDKITQHMRFDIESLKAEISLLEQTNCNLKQENLRISQLQSTPSYYMNPVHEKQKLDQKLVEEVVQLEAVNLQKDHDIQILVDCIKMAKMNIIEGQQDNGNNKLLKDFSKKLKTLYTIDLSNF